MESVGDGVAEEAAKDPDLRVMGKEDLGTERREMRRRMGRRRTMTKMTRRLSQLRERPRRTKRERSPGIG